MTDNDVEMVARPYHSFNLETAKNHIELMKNQDAWRAEIKERMKRDPKPKPYKADDPSEAGTLYYEDVKQRLDNLRAYYKRVHKFTDDLVQWVAAQKEQRE